MAKEVTEILEAMTAEDLKRRREIAEKLGNVVQESEAIKQNAETTYHSAEKLQKNVERFIV